MAVFLITYDLDENKEYDDLYKTIKEFKSSWHYLKSAWLIKTNENLPHVCNKIEATLKNGESYFVVEISKNYNGFLPEEAWQWLREHLNLS